MTQRGQGKILFSPRLTFQIEGEMEKDSLAKATYQDLHAKRPICAKLLDHNNQIIDTSRAGTKDTEYQSTINKLQVNMWIKSRFNKAGKSPLRGLYVQTFVSS